jgi:hypothetical protein
MRKSLDYYLTQPLAEKLRLRSLLKEKIVKSGKKHPIHKRSITQYANNFKITRSIRLFGFRYPSEGNTKAPFNIKLPIHSHSQTSVNQLIPDLKSFLSNKIKPHVVEPEVLSKTSVARVSTARKFIRILKRKKAGLAAVIPKLQKDNVFDKDINKDKKLRLYSPNKASFKVSPKIMNEMYFSRVSKRYSTTSYSHISTRSSIKEEPSGNTTHKICNNYYRNNFTITSRQVPRRAGSILLSSLVGEAGKAPRSNGEQTGCGMSTKCSTFNQLYGNVLVDNHKTDLKSTEFKFHAEQSKRLNTANEDMRKGCWQYRKLNSEVCLIKHIM